MDGSVEALLWIVVGGLIIGVVVRLLMPGRPRLPVWAAMVAGASGMLIGDWLAGMLRLTDAGMPGGARRAVQAVTGIVLVMIVGAAFAGASAARARRAGRELSSGTDAEDA